MNKFTPELGPPLVVPDGSARGVQEWQRRVTRFLNDLRDEIDVKMEAFISSSAQMGVGVAAASLEDSAITSAHLQNSGITLTDLSTLTIISTSVSLAISATTQVTISTFPGTVKRPMVHALCTAAGWFVSLAGMNSAFVILNCYNRSASTATVNVFAYFIV